MEDGHDTKERHYDNWARRYIAAGLQLTAARLLLAAALHMLDAALLLLAAAQHQLDAA